MSMILGVTMLGDENIGRVLSDPLLIWRVLAPDDPEMYEQARRERSVPSLLGRLFGRQNRQAAPPRDLPLVPPEGTATDLDKAWHGIHYLLTRTAWEGTPPLSFLVAAGRGVGDIDVGYGPARVFTAAETRSIAEALDALTPEDLRSRFDPADMTAKKIYPEIWSGDSPDEETIDYLLEYYETLRGFIRRAADSHVGIVVSIS